MSPPAVIDVRGHPRPQGSMKMHRLPNGATAVRYPPEVYAWRAQVQQEAAAAMVDPFLGPVVLTVRFDLPRPAAHYGRGRNAQRVKPSAPLHPAAMPDLDKLVRAVGDALTDAGIWKDDAQVVELHAAKRYVTFPKAAGVRITIQEAT